MPGGRSLPFHSQATFRLLKFAALIWSRAAYRVRGVAAGDRGPVALLLGVARQSGHRDRHDHRQCPHEGVGHPAARRSVRHESMSSQSLGTFEKSGQDGPFGPRLSTAGRRPGLRGPRPRWYKQATPPWPPLPRRGAATAARRSPGARPRPPPRRLGLGAFAVPLGLTAACWRMSLLGRVSQSRSLTLAFWGAGAAAAGLAGRAGGRSRGARCPDSSARRRGRSTTSRCAAT